jgi:ubiquinone biosynthesis accessory factor UbiK
VLAPAAEDKAMNFEAGKLDELARKLTEALPGGLQTLKADVESNFRAVLQAGLARMDLVTRQDFDVQAGVLARTRAKLEALEARLAGLEARLGGGPPAP